MANAERPWDSQNGTERITEFFIWISALKPSLSRLERMQRYMHVRFLFAYASIWLRFDFLFSYKLAENKKQPEFCWTNVDCEYGEVSSFRKPVLIQYTTFSHHPTRNFLSPIFLKMCTNIPQDVPINEYTFVFGKKSVLKSYRNVYIFGF